MRFSARPPLLLLALALVSGDAPADELQMRIGLVADRDDDDANGVADGAEVAVSRGASVDLVKLPDGLVGLRLDALSGGERVRMIIGGRPVPWATAVIKGALLQGVAVGRAELRGGVGARQVAVTVDVQGLFFRDGAGLDVSPSTAHAQIARTAPAQASADANAPFDDPDALRVVLALPGASLSVETPRDLAVESFSASGEPLDLLAGVALGPAACPTEVRAPARCFASAPLRFAADAVDRTHPLVERRSLLAEVGGAVVVRSGGAKLSAIRVLGPRTSPAGPIGRLRARIHAYVVRTQRGGAPSIGGTDSGATQTLRSELAMASAIWGQCGVSFGDARSLDVTVVDPPLPHLLAIGNDLGLPASGGELRVRADGNAITVRLRSGATPRTIASDLAQAIERVGLRAVVSPNARIPPGAGASVDVLLRRKNGAIAAFEAPLGGGPLSTDATLSVHIGYVDLADGLQHFRDVDSVSGTIEERTLLKSLDGDAPGTIAVVVVPAFEGTTRIGESFIRSDGSSLRNIVLLDRSGIRARRSSLTLAHELGHVLLDQPGHPDDFGFDTPTRLMDSDASDASVFGPRRLTVEECAQVVLQSGPDARKSLLVRWPIGPMSYASPRAPSAR